MVKIRTLFLSFTILAFLLFSTIGTTTVYADDGTGTETPTEETPPAGDEEQPSEGATEEAPPVEAQPMGLERQPGQVQSTGENPDVDPIVSFTNNIPANTTITILDTDGESLPLVTQESADAIASAYDPIWCPAGQPPIPGQNGCTTSFGSFDDLLSYLKEHEEDFMAAGTIFINQGNYQGGESGIDFNNYDFDTFDDYDLTLQGGWDTSWTPESGTDPEFTETIFDLPIIIGSGDNPWAGSLTINDIVIDGVYGQTGLELHTDGDINLDNVHVTDSQTGAELDAGHDVNVDNSSFNNNKKGGATITAGNEVNINGTTFDSNGSKYTDGYGLKIENGGAVNLYQVSASKNEIYGADITSSGDVSIDFSMFSGNISYTYHCKSKSSTGGYGLKVVSQGNVFLDDVHADENYLFGADIVSTAEVIIANGTFNNNGSGKMSNPTGYGLQVTGTGDVTLRTVTANNNQLFGANITTVGEVEVLDSFFNGNKSYTYSCKDGKVYQGYGLQIVTTDDAFLENVYAEENHLFGARIEANDVAIDTGFFSNNGSGNAYNLTGSGLQVIAEIDVAIANVIADNNQLFGADISAGDVVAIENSSFSGTISYVYDCHGQIKSSKGGYGLRVVTGGDIAVEDVTANGNYLYGAYIEGNDIAIEDSFFDANGSGFENKPTGFGLQVVSTGDVDLININDAESTGNQLFGADVKAVGDVTVINAFFSGNQSISFNPCTGLEFHGYGLKVVTDEDIFLRFVTANHNNLWGASLSGYTVDVLDSQFNNNVSDSNVFIDDTGLIINATFDANLLNVDASFNRLTGADITAGNEVFIINSTFIGNKGITCEDAWCHQITYHGYGLKVTTPGYIYVADTTASENNLFGAQLNGGAIDILNSVFNFNGSGDNKNPTGKGLEVVATGNVTLLNVDASYNELFGANIQSDGNVTVTASMFNGNKHYTYSCKGSNAGGYGLKVVAVGDILLNADESGVGNMANDNGAEGAILENNTTITVQDSTFNNNGATGLTITGNVVVLDNVTTVDNGIDGTRICANDVTVTNGVFDNNNRYGLNVGSPVFVESDNSFLGNGSQGLFYNPSCDTDTNNNGDHHYGKGWWKWGKGKWWGKSNWGWGYKWGHGFKK